MNSKTIARWYFCVVKEKPVIHLAVCLWGLAVAVGAWLQFGGGNDDPRLTLFLRTLAVLMVGAYGWILAALIVRIANGQWRDHCDRSIASLDQSIADHLVFRGR